MALRAAVAPGLVGEEVDLAGGHRLAVERDAAGDAEELVPVRAAAADEEPAERQGDPDGRQAANRRRRGHSDLLPGAGV